MSILQNTSGHEPGWNTLGKDGSINYSEMLKTARTFTRLGEGLCASAVGAQAQGAVPSVAQSGADVSGPGAGAGAAQVDMGGLLDPALLALTPGGGLDLSSLGTEWLAGTGLSGPAGQGTMMGADYQALL